MTYEINEFNPVEMLFIQTPTEITFTYKGIQVTKRVIDSGYWLYWVDKYGHCYIKQFY
jgi:hypothetical protein